MMSNWKRTTPLQNIAFVSIMGAVNGVVSLLLSLIPYSTFIAIIILPIINALGVYLVDKKWFALYAITSIAIPFLVTMFDMSTTIFYVIPSIISGFIYGALSKLKLPTALTIFGSTLWVLLSTYASLPIISAIYGIDMIESVVALLKLKPFAVKLIPSFLFAFSWASTSISHFLISFAYEKIGFDTKNFKWEKFVYPFISIALGIASMIVTNFNLEGCYILLSLSIYFAAFSLQNLIVYHPIWIVSILISLAVASVLGFAFLYDLMPFGGGGSLLSLFVVGSSISCFIASFKAKLLAE